MGIEPLARRPTPHVVEGHDDVPVRERLGLLMRDDARGLAPSFTARKLGTKPARALAPNTRRTVRFVDDWAEFGGRLFVFRGILLFIVVLVVRRLDHRSDLGRTCAFAMPGAFVKMDRAGNQAPDLFEPGTFFA